jgi:hypothetical protein
MGIRLVLYGLLGWCVEIVWSACREKLTGRQQGWALRGATSLWMFPIYGASIALLFEPAHDALRVWPWEVRGLVYTLGIFAIEYASGWALRRWAGGCPWDYAGHSRWHLNGLIRLDYAPAWFLAGLGLERVHDVLAALTPVIARALS